MSAETEVTLFLNDFKAKMHFWDVLFRDDRGKNAQALMDLERAQHKMNYPFK